MEIQTYGSKQEILKYPEQCIAIGRALDRTAFEAIAAANDGVVPAGTFVHMDLENRATKAVPADGTNVAVGVLRYDVELKGKLANAAAIVIEGYVDLDKIPTEPTSQQKTELTFVRFLR